MLNTARVARDQLLATMLAVLTLWLASASGIAAPAQAPGSHLVLDLPEGYAASPTFSGFVHRPTGVTILLLEVPASAYPDMKKGLSPETLSRQGMSHVQTGTLEREGEHVYVTAEQATPAGSFTKFILLFREGPLTALVSASVPKSTIESGHVSPEAIARTLASARLAPDAGEKPYALGYTGPFRDTGAFIGQSHFYAIVDPPGKKRDGSSMPPSLIVASALDGSRVENLEAMGRTGVKELMGGEEPEDVQSQRLEIAGLDAVESIVPPSSSGGGAESGIYQVVLRAKQGGYYRIVGKAPAPEWPALLPEFRKIAQSFTPRT